MRKQSQKVIILFDTKRGSTEKIASWIKDELCDKGIEVDTARITDVATIPFENYDLLMIGSPIYFEKPLKSVLKFTREHSEELSHIRVVVFVVNMADLFGHLTESYIETRYIGAIASLLRNPPVLTHSIRGWIRKPGEKTREDIKDFVRKVTKII